MSINKVILLGKEFRLGLGFLNLLIDETGKDLTELGTEMQVNSPVIVPKMMLYSLQYAAQRNGTEFKETIHDIYDLIDENGGTKGEFWESFLLAFNKSMYADVPVDTEKKKVKAVKK